MAFVSRLTAEFAIAGGVSGRALSDRAQFGHAPQEMLLHNISFVEKLPRYDGTLKIEGDCAGHAGVNDGDFVLYDTKASPHALSEGDVVVVDAAAAYPDIKFAEGWKSLRVVDAVTSDDILYLSSMAGGGEKRKQEIPLSNFIGRAVYAFSA